MLSDKTANVARGKWRGILMSLGLPEEFLKNKHGPCPLCNSDKNFRFDDKEGRGTWICTCGSGDGINLAMEFTGRPFYEIASEIDSMVGNVKYDAPNEQSGMTAEQKRNALRATYKATQPLQSGDLVDRYLTARGVGEVTYPDSLRFAPSIRDGDGGIRPAMVAMIVDRTGKPVSMHRTFLRPDGRAKAEMECPRKIMPGELPEGSCVRLSEYVSGGALGIAEGIETAMSASAMYGLPVWSAINTALLKKWLPPEGCKQIAIFADNDPKYGGQAAAFLLAHRLAVRDYEVSVHVPDTAGIDWNDLHLSQVRLSVVNNG
jgi:putative DNA primase/helicase